MVSRALASDRRSRRGIYLSLVGGAVEALAGFTSTVITVRSVSVWRDEGAEDRAFARDFFGRLLVGAVLVIGGAVGGALLGLQLPGRLPNSFLMLLLALIGGTIGAYMRIACGSGGIPIEGT